MKKILLSIIILPQVILSLYPKLNLESKIGIGYYFNNKKIVKKFYSKNFILPPQNIKEHIYKSKNIFLKENKTFTVKTSYTKNQAVIEVKDEYTHNSVTSPKLRKTISINGSFNEPFNMYIDIYPNKNITLPKWTKSIDFWVKNTPYKNLNIAFFLKYPSKELIHKLNIPQHIDKWKKIYFNIANNKENRNKKNILITKIRISKRDNSFPAFFSLNISIPNAYNYIKNDYNLYKIPHKNIEDFKENTQYLKYSLNNLEYIKSPKVKEYEKPYNTNNKTYLSLNIEKHNNKSLFIHFPQNKYKLLFEHNIGMWINGNEGKEQVSVLFQEGKKRYFELALKEIYFKGWKALKASIPRKHITYFKDEYGQKYIYIIGIKITPVSKNKNINIDIDSMEAIIDTNALGNIQKL